MPHLRAAIEAFPPAAVRAWCEGLGQDTFVGSSGRVFPKAFKTSPLLRAWLRRLDAAGVALQAAASLDRLGRARRRSLFDDARRARDTFTPTPRCWRSAARAGRGSAPTAAGSMRWRDAGIAIAPLRPANCGFVANWSEVFRDRFEGQPLKRIELSFGGQSVRGEALITRHGPRGRRHLCAVRAAARGHRRGGRSDAAHRSASGSVARRAAAAARSAARQAIAVDVPAQGASTCRRAAIGLLHEAIASHARALCRHGCAATSPRSSTPCRCA